MKFGITEVFPCNYIPDEKERLLVHVDSDNTFTSFEYDILLQAGFRRSGSQVYRPHCPECNACQSLRVLVANFQPSKSQKRVMSKNKHLVSTLSDKTKPEHYALYENYISERHSDGSMYPPSMEQYEQFIFNGWQQPLFLEIYDADDLIAVAVTDETPSSLSALYTYFDPEYTTSSLGSFAILEQIRWAKVLNKQYVYLGYQINSCDKMKYKQNFQPNEQYINQQWRSFQKMRN